MSIDLAELERIAKEQLSAPLTLSRTLLVSASTLLALVARVREAEARIEKVVRLRDRMEQQRDDIDESVRLSTILVDLNAALDEGDEQ